ncbi:hypothetical protein METBIDRAFT_44570 [Metschnikowia bicuspidata var. bicuspidata NRRL YB-4993]|uniref:Multifunctional tryptophan biosynthesis protein n=1 Tax=Metschnikowia bicuspidata var. bicuspidata NRRL YB-4993 TaxID=869754 RepID=A0A1A0H6X2_9ASCO|nr:hypothetical protein METBIDRAFT_44570 [Metschnikowia bicuspidata var. bicuspidata NRRL YB-4993]OBA19844.1 hypothetical protein METBIDRAFT_44570 [Metschnikowia bicuspidata var. bicuspidata NRRL YB-4993]
MTSTSSGKRVVMIDNYDSFTWNLYQFLCQSKYSAVVEVYRNDEIDIETIENVVKPDILFISPGPGHPSTDAGISKSVIDHFKGKIPIFGVCMGQQCMVEVFGGTVSFAGEIVHGKTSTIRHDGKGVFAGVPQGAAVTRYHSLAGLKANLPECLEVTATTETDPEVIMGIRHKEYTIEGVQFHPESILTEAGQILIDNVLKLEGGYWADNKVSEPVKENILTKIYKARVADYEKIEQVPGQKFSDLETSLALGVAPPVINFYERLIHTRNKGQNVILSEFKRASPSKGDININAHPAVQALTYAQNGCSAISVLTEPTWFKGSLGDMSVIRKVIDQSPELKDYTRPAVLRKEFIFNEYQILEARLAGADTVLLIVKMLQDAALLQRLYEYSLSLGMVPLVEVNDGPELKTALALTVGGTTEESLVIGVNNRNLTTFDVDLGTTSSLVLAAKNSGRKGDVLVLALSGISLVEDVSNYKKDNVDGFLIGESLMRAQERGEAGKFLNELINV